MYSVTMKPVPGFTECEWILLMARRRMSVPCGVAGGSLVVTPGIVRPLDPHSGLSRRVADPRLEPSGRPQRLTRTWTTSNARPSPPEGYDRDDPAIIAALARVSAVLAGLVRTRYPASDS
jgi:hypothetical protein